MSLQAFAFERTFVLGTTPNTDWNHQVDTRFPADPGIGPTNGVQMQALGDGDCAWERLEVQYEDGQVAQFGNGVALHKHPAPIVSFDRYRRVREVTTVTSSHDKKRSCYFEVSLVRSE